MRCGAPAPRGGGGAARAAAAKPRERGDPRGDGARGVGIVRRALEDPARQLALNAGQEGSIIVEQMRQQAAGWGYDVLSGKFVEMMKAGIVDPGTVGRRAVG